MDQMGMATIRSRLFVLEMDNQSKLDELYALQREIEGIQKDMKNGAAGRVRSGEEAKKMEEIEILSRLCYFKRDNQVKGNERFPLQEGLGGGGIEIDVEWGAGGDEGGGGVESAACGEISKAVTIHGPEENVMTNPAILSKIFFYLDLSTLVGLRPVCKVWDEVVIAMPAINPKLAKNISIQGINWCVSGSVAVAYDNLKIHDPAQTTDTAFKNLMTFFNQYHHNVKNIRVECDWEDHAFYNNALVQALSILDFPKLQDIVILDTFNTSYFYGCCWDWDEDENDFFSTLTPFATKPVLTSLHLYDTIAGSPFHDVFQKLINSAPNLEEITIEGNFYPDLSTCKNLKTLSYSGIPYYYEDRDLQEEHSFNLESLSKMLDQVKHSLIKLSLDDAYLDCDGWRSHPQLEKFKFPDVVKKLEILSIEESVDQPFFQPELKKLNSVQFPTLKNLSIDVKSLDNVLGGISHSFEKISSLYLGRNLSPDIRHRIPILFPNLTSLTMSRTMNREEKPDFSTVIDLPIKWL